MRFMPEKLEAARNFANKVWNAAKFVLMNLEDADEKILNSEISDLKLQVEDKWIISKLNTLIKEVNVNIENYNLGVALDSIYTFIWNEFCDWYVEIVKSRLYDKEDSSRSAAQYVLNKVLGDSLKLLHPFMPFITEKIYTSLFVKDESIMISNFPQYNEDNNYQNEERFIEEIKELITEIRNIRANLKVHPSRKSNLLIVSSKYGDEIKESIEFLKKLSFAKEILVQSDIESVPQNIISVFSANIQVYIPSEDLIDIEEEIERLQKEKEKVIQEKEKIDTPLNNEGFIKKAPAEKVKEYREKQKQLEEKIKSINDRLEKLGCNAE